MVTPSHMLAGWPRLHGQVGEDPVNPDHRYLLPPLPHPPAEVAA